MNLKHKEEQSHIIGYIISGSILTGFFIFISGYYWGKKHTITKLSEEISQGYLADKIESSTYKTNSLIRTEGKLESETKSDFNSEDNKETELYYAQLAGFSSLSSAKITLTKINKSGVDAHIITRISKTARGTKKNWYQIISNSMTRKELNNELKKVKYIINISQVNFIKTQEQK